MGKKLSEEVAVDSDTSMEDVDVSDAKPSAAENSSSESNSRQSSSDSDSGSEADAKTNVKYDRLTSPKEERELIFRGKRSTQNKPTQRPAAAFRPPPGFTSKYRSKPSSATSALSNLDGKQIFHIAAPSFLPLSQIREIALDKALLGEPVLTHKGVDYGLPADQEAAAAAAGNLQTLLIYDEKKGVYVKKELQNIPSYTVQELVRLPNNNETAVQVKDKPARPQPKHLKMRFHPVGSGNLGAETIGSSSESEAENDQHEPTFIVPRLEQKRKTDGRDDQGEKKKKKKEKHASSSQEADQKRGRQDGESEKKASKHRNETSEERRARKEKKKRKAEK